MIARVVGLESRLARRVLVLLCLCVGLVGLGSGVASAASGPGTVSGTVTWSDTGDPTAGATVTVYSGDITSTDPGNEPATPVATVTTAANGTYSVPGLTAGDYTLFWSDPNFTGGIASGGTGYPGYTQVVVSAGATTTANVSLYGFRAISGTVTNAAGQPLSDVNVQVVGGGQSTTTAADGSYTIDDVGASFDLLFSDGSSSGYYTGPGQPLTADESSAVAVTVPADSTTTGVSPIVSPPPPPVPNSVSGTVVSASSGQPIAGVTVEAWGPDVSSDYSPLETTTTAADGSYTLANLNGDTLIRFNPGNQNFVEQWYGGSPGGAITSATPVNASGAVTAINASLVTGATISGTVTNASGAPLANAQVTAVMDNGGAQTATASATTNADGTYTIAGLPSATYLVSFTSADGQNTAWYDATGSVPSAAEAQALQLGVGQTVTQINGTPYVYGAISGTVTYAAGGQPVPNVIVGAYEDGELVATATTAADGTYTLSDLDAGSYEVYFYPTTGPGLATWYPGNPDVVYAGSVPVTEGQTASGIDQTLDQGASISGVVRQVNGAPLAGAKVVLYQGSRSASPWEYNETTTAADGSYSFPGVPARPSFIEFESGNHATWYAGRHQASVGSLSAAKAIVVNATSQVTGVDGTPDTRSAGYSGAIAGRVIGCLSCSNPTATGNSESGVSVKVFREPRGSGDLSRLLGRTTTNSDGTYTVTGLAPADDYVVEFAKAGYVTLFWPSAGDQREVITVAAESTTPRINFVMETQTQLQSEIRRAHAHTRTTRAHPRGTTAKAQRSRPST